MCTPHFQPYVVGYRDMIVRLTRSTYMIVTYKEYLSNIMSLFPVITFIICHSQTDAPLMTSESTFEFLTRFYCGFV